MANSIGFDIRSTETYNNGGLVKVSISKPDSDLYMLTENELQKIFKSLSYTLDFVPHPRVDDMTDAWFRTEGYFRSEPW